MIRYLSIFYHPILNNFDDEKIVMTTRIFCGLTSLLSILFDDHVNGPDYAYLTNKNLDRNYISNQKNFKITIMVNLVVLVLVQMKIEIFKKSVDESHQINDNEENQETNSEYNKNSDFNSRCQ